jgi:hypothetical protein
MTARISKSFVFQSGVYFNDSFIMNVYDVEMHFNIHTENIREQNISLERVKFFIRENIESAVFVEEKNKTVIDSFVDAGIKVCALPEEPYDQIIGIMLLCKLNAIMEDRMELSDISITSWMSDGVTCNHSIDESMGPFVDSGWWNDNTPRAYVSKSNATKSKKLVKLVKSMYSWDEVYLGWGENIEPTNTFNSEVVFACFDKKVDKKD